MRRPLEAATLMALALPLTGLLGGLLAGCATGPGHAGPQYYAEPADVIAAELAFSRLAQQKGQWTAWRDTAARDAQMFAHQNGATAAVRVDAYTRGRANPPVSVSWDPQAVWMSCDSSIAVTYGAWRQAASGAPANQAPNTAGQAETGWPSTGWYITVWQHQKKGGYKWVLDLGDALPRALPAPEMISAKLADCPARHSRGLGAFAAHQNRVNPEAPAPDAGPPNYLANEAKDHTLAWTSAVSPAGAASFTLRLKQDGQMREVLRLPAPTDGPAHGPS